MNASTELKHFAISLKFAISLEFIFPYLNF